MDGCKTRDHIEVYLKFQSVAMKVIFDTSTNSCVECGGVKYQNLLVAVWDVNVIREERSPSGV